VYRERVEKRLMVNQVQNNSTLAVGMRWPWAWQPKFYLHSGCWIGEFQKTTSHTDDVIQKIKWRGAVCSIQPI
jgi:hypothetical protein